MKTQKYKVEMSILKPLISIKSFMCLFLIAILSVSCEEKSQKCPDCQIIYSPDNMSYIFDFPDTVYKNKEYSGVIIYKNVLDTITKKLSNNLDSIRSRDIYYTLAKTQTLKHSDNTLTKMAVDTFAAIDYRTIPLFNLKFEKEGVNYIDGFITDIGYIKKDTDSVRMITNEFRVAHKVVVIDRDKQ
ncbi:hypothetical protein [Flavobacterium akiainvivens]|nr:hypothetical protein [Flavobacterium akiainvivens]SFQ22984.1 hypothetical protein SAMN05444144_10268 [Flavobacterium akiainvivens]